MKKVEDYRNHAVECRLMANRSRTQADRNMLLKMAETWLSLATHREAHLARQQRLEAIEKGPGGRSIAEPSSQS
jgi:hypothetical protein